MFCGVSMLVIGKVDSLRPISWQNIHFKKSSAGCRHKTQAAGLQGRQADEAGGLIRQAG
jgi:hypothetical protein